MKSVIYCLFTIVCTSSCTMPNFYQVQINDIPTVVPNFYTEIRFIGDSLPKNPYFEIIDLDKIEKGRFSKNDVQKFLEIEAINEGVDAFIEVDYWRESISETTFLAVLIDVLDEDTEPTAMDANYTHIRARGIMYLENLDFIKDQPEFEYYYKIRPTDDFPLDFCKVEYKLTGQEFMVYPYSEDARDWYKNYVQFYSDFHLQRQREGWSYKMDGTLLKKRTFRNLEGVVLKNCIFHYNKSNKLIQIEIVHNSREIHATELVNYSYDAKGKLIKRIIHVHDGAKIFEDFVYENNRLTGKRILINKSSQAQIFFKTTMLYYDADYLRNYYFNEHAGQNSN